MPDANTVLLPICVGLSLLGIIGTGLAWRRENKGRVLQGIALAITPVGLYFTGLLRVVWNMVTDIVGWAARLAFSPLVWLGFALLALSVVLFVVGGFAAKRLGASRSGQSAAEGSKKPAVDSGRRTKGAESRQQASDQQQPIDDEMKEIEELLKARGIE